MENISIEITVCTFSRFGAMESISSIKMIAGAFFSASSNALRRLDSDSPAIFDITSGPLMRKKNAPVSLATARAMSVLPVPGGPKSNMPRVNEAMGIHTSWWFNANAFEELWVTQGQFNKLANLGHLLTTTTNIVVSNLIEI